MIDEKLFSKIATEVESDQGWGGLSGSGNMYYEYAKEITLRYIEQSRHLTSATHSDGEKQCNCVSGRAQSTGGCPIHGCTF